MSKFERLVDRINFPMWAVCLHEYGDQDGCTEQDVQDYDQWRDSVLDPLYDQGYDCLLISIGCDDEPYFSHSPAFGLPCDCFRAFVWGEKKEVDK